MRFLCLFTDNRELKIGPQTRSVYTVRDKKLDTADPDIPVLPPDLWHNAIIGKYYRPKKTPVTFRADNDVLALLKAKGGWSPHTD